MVGSYKFMYYVYVLCNCVDKIFYIGYISDLRKRIREHREGKVYSTYRSNQGDLLYYESFKEKTDAQRRERYFKTTKGKRS